MISFKANLSNTVMKCTSCGQSEKLKLCGLILIRYLMVLKIAKGRCIFLRLWHYKEKNLFKIKNQSHTINCCITIDELVELMETSWSYYCCCIYSIILLKQHVNLSFHLHWPIKAFPKDWRHLTKCKCRTIIKWKYEDQLFT